ncbi:RB1-inducible coiled-coil protein 1-like isoform X1 [Ornithodoros turicata]|uniref:RB1-inducible coiled-coil protein 1-like isoform X1 n=1 Tax=Ornithodoros turicata TaxID=34597 RepID=UPI00313873F3
MLYVFRVDTGKMMTFDMNHALESVEHLKGVIAQECDVSPDKQVLLVSGGESLHPAAAVGRYSAGTDTNPIFLFNRAAIESEVPLQSSEHQLSYRDMREEVDAALTLPPAYNTVVARTQLAQEFFDLARGVTKACELLVHDQHLQQQGWAAVVANLEDTTVAFRNRASAVEQEFQNFLLSHSDYSALLDSFSEDLKLLGKIPILPALLSRNTRPTVNVPSPSLLEWISSKDAQSSLDQMAEQCNRGLKQLNQGTLESLQGEVQAALSAADNSNMKEIKGLEERLFGLEDLMHKAQRLVQDQQELAQAFLQNQSRASHLKDPSIFPDLCSSHAKQLQIMVDNHRQLRDIQRRCAAAKDELSTNLKTRLRWIIYVETSISEVSRKLVFNHENMKRLHRYLELCRQIHMAPGIYVRAVVEVVRRRSFSVVFLEWAKNISGQCRELLNTELRNRQEFNSQISSHFLSTLFPGLSDIPPSFATQDPGPFDDKLPMLAMSDIDFLREALPEMSEWLDVVQPPDMPRAFAQSPNSSCTSGAPSQQAAEMSSKSSVTTTKMDTTLDDSDHKAALQDRSFSGQEGALSGSEKKEMDGSQPACGQDRDKTPKNIESDEEFEEVSEVPSAAAPDGINAAAERSLGGGEPRETVGHRLSVAPESDSATSYAVAAGQGDPMTTQSPDSLPQLQLVSHHPSQGNTSQDFMTADFYIDESMPSSYSDSNGTTVRNNGSLTKSHHVIVAELQQQLEEKNENLAEAEQGELQQNYEQLRRLRGVALGLRAMVCVTQSQMRSDLKSLREDLERAHRFIVDQIRGFAERFNGVIAGMQDDVEDSKRRAVESALADMQHAYEAMQSKCQNQLEVEEKKLEDAHNEVEMYQEKLRELSQMMDSLKHDSDSALGNLQSNMNEEREALVAKMTLEHELELEAAMEKLMNLKKDHEEVVQELDECLREKDRQIQMLCREKQDLEESLTLRFVEEKAQLQAHWEQLCSERESRLVQELDGNHEQELKGLRLQHETMLAEVREATRLQCQRDWEAKLSELKEGMHDKPSDMETSQDDSHKEDDLAQVLLQEQEKHQSEITLLKQDFEARISQLQADHEKALQEALNRTVQDNVDSREESQNRENELAVCSEKEPGQEATLGQQDCENLSYEGISKVTPLLDVSVLSQSRMDTLTATSMMESTVKLPMLDPVSELRNQLQYKEQEVSKLQQKIMEMSDVSGAQAPPIPADKVSILTCNVGDVVLLCYDEGHQNYVLFVLGPVLHFLHTECLETLGLRPGPGCTRKGWVLAEVVEKEYCQAKKPQNRYRVAVGTRFYRIKAKPWDKEAAVRREQQRRQSLKALSSLQATAEMSTSQEDQAGTSEERTS